MASAAAIVEWVSGTGLKPFVDRLTADLQASYLAQYERRIAQAYPPAPTASCCWRSRACSSWQKAARHERAPPFIPPTCCSGHRPAA
jgi:hypothetical protein